MHNSKIYAIFLMLLVYLPNCNQNKYGQTYSGKTENDWFESMKWLDGLELKPDKSINSEEFTHQYYLNKKWWREAFNFLKTHDLKSLSPGKYVIDSGNVFATVWEGVPKIKDSVQWEAHRDFNDLQYIIQGEAQMGVASIDNPDKKITFPYSKEQEIEHFTVTKGDKYYKADSTTFFIFSPKEIHRPAINIDGNKPIKKMVIKVRVPN